MCMGGIGFLWPFLLYLFASRLCPEPHLYHCAAQFLQFELVLPEQKYLLTISYSSYFLTSHMLENQKLGMHRKLRFY